MKTLATCLLLLALPALADVKIDKKADQIDVTIDGTPFTTFYFGANLQKPYLHPLRAADGTVMTRRWPIETDVAGESKDHPHHQALWIGQKHVNGVNFWENAKGGAGIGTIAMAKLVKAKGGGKSGVIEVVLDWKSPEGKVLLREERKMTFYAGSPNRMFDMDAKMTAVEGNVDFGDTKEGTFAIRLNDKLTEKSKGGQMVNAGGAAGMKAVWGKPSPWVDYSGSIDSKPLGIAILNHPTSLNHPTRWHSRDYGLFAANPLAEKEMTGGKEMKAGGFQLEKGKSFWLRHRVIIHPGSTADAKIADAWTKYKSVK